MASCIKYKKKKASGGGQFRLFKSVMRPRLLLVLTLLFCWDSSNGNTSPNRVSFLHSQQHTPIHHKSFSSYLDPPEFHPRQNNNVAELFFDEGGPLLSGSGLGVGNTWLAGINTQEMTLVGNEDPDEGVRHKKNVKTEEDPVGIVGGIGNGVMIKPEEQMRRRKKQDCGVPTVAVRSYLDPTLLKRSYFANTHEDVEAKQQEEESLRLRLKRDAAMSKRNDINGDGPLPWTCETKYEWEDKGADHYPRFVRTASCKSRFCFNGFFRCKPRRYKTKVLKRLTGTEVASCEEDDVSLPESLRSTWKFVTVTINLCCDCASRVPGVDV